MEVATKLVRLVANVVRLRSAHSVDMAAPGRWVKRTVYSTKGRRHGDAGSIVICESPLHLMPFSRFCRPQATNGKVGRYLAERPVLFGALADLLRLYSLDQAEVSSPMRFHREMRWDIAET